MYRATWAGPSQSDQPPTKMRGPSRFFQELPWYYWQQLSFASWFYCCEIFLPFPILFLAVLIWSFLWGIRRRNSRRLYEASWTRKHFTDDSKSSRPALNFSLWDLLSFADTSSSRWFAAQVTHKFLVISMFVCWWTLALWSEYMPIVHSSTWRQYYIVSRDILFR